MPQQGSEATPQEWQAAVEALRLGSEQLLVRLAALERSGQMSLETARGYAGWTARVAIALNALAALSSGQE